LDIGLVPSDLVDSFGSGTWLWAWRNRGVAFLRASKLENFEVPDDVGSNSIWSETQMKLDSRIY
jgi:hypothetical protein